MGRDKEQSPSVGSSQEFVPYNQWLHQHDEDIRKNFPERMTDDMAREYDVNYYTVSRRATRLGVGKSDEFMRSAWRKGSLTKYKIRGEERKRFKRAADEYLKAHFHDTSNAELAALFGVDVKTVRRWARRLGLQKSEDFMNKSRVKKKCYYTDEHKAWRNKRISEVYPNADEEGLQRLAEELGIQQRWLQRLACKLGLKRSPEQVSGAMRRGHDKSRKYSRELIAAVSEYYPYHSTAECAEKFGIHYGTLKVMASVNGWKKDREFRRRQRSEISRRWHREKNNK